VFIIPLSTGAYQLTAEDHHIQTLEKKTIQ